MQPTVVERSSDYRRGYWDALDAVLTLLNLAMTEEDITQDAMRRRIYGLVMDLKA